MIWFAQNSLALGLLFLTYLSIGQTCKKLVWQNVSLISKTLQLLVCFYLGLCIWFIIVTALGLTGQFKTVNVVFISLIFIVFNLKSLFILMRSASKEVYYEIKSLKQHSMIWKLLYFVPPLLILSCFGGVGNSALEDGAAFYLPIGKMAAHSGWLERLPGYDKFSAVGLVGELQMATLMLFDAEDSARLLGWLCFFPVFALFLGFAKKFLLSSQATIFLLICVFSSTAVSYIVGGGKIDLFAAALGLMGLYFLFFEKEIKVAGLMLAFACVAKLSLFIPFFPLVVVGLIYQSQSPKFSFKEFFKKNFIVGFIFVLVLLPHLIKNYIFFKNPFAPYFGSEPAWETSWYSAETTKRILLTYPLVWFYGWYWAQFGNLALPVLVFLPFYFKRKFFSFKNWSAQNYFLCGLLTGMLLWMVLRPTFIAPRYILAVLLCFAPFAAAGFDRWRNRNLQNPKSLALIGILLIVWSVHSLERMQKSNVSWFRSYNYLSNNWPYCARDAYHCYIIQEMNRVVPLGSRVLQLAYFSYWFRGDLLQTMRKEKEYDLLKGNSPEEVWRKIYEHNFTYLYIDQTSHADKVKEYYIDKAPSWVSFEKIAEWQYVSAYKIVYKEPTGLTKKWLVENDNGHWVVKTPVELY